MTKTILSRSCILGAMVLTLVACQTPEASVDGTARLTADGLAAVQNAPFDEAYVKPDIDLSSFDSLVLADIMINYSPDRDEYRLSEETQSEFVSTFTEILLEELTSTSGKTITNVSGPGTLYLNIKIDDVKINANRDADFAGTTYTFAESAGKISISGSLKNAANGEVLSRFSDVGEHRNGMFERVDRMSATREFKRIMQKWAETISSGIQEMSE